MLALLLLSGGLGLLRLLCTTDRSLALWGWEGSRGASRGEEENDVLELHFKRIKDALVEASKL